MIHFTHRIPGVIAPGQGKKFRENPKSGSVVARRSSYGWRNGVQRLKKEVTCLGSGQVSDRIDPPTAAQRRKYKIYCTE